MPRASQNSARCPRMKKMTMSFAFGDADWIVELVKGRDHCLGYSTMAPFDDDFEKDASLIRTM